jgi:hypothetical protein
VQGGGNESANAEGTERGEVRGGDGGGKEE